MTTSSTQDLRATTQINVINLTYVWSIINFSFATEKNTEFIESPIFNSPDDPDKKWHLKLYPNGYNRDHLGAVGMFLNLDFDRLSDTEIKTKYKFDILDKNNTIFKTLSDDAFFKRDRTALGWNRMLNRTDLFKKRDKLLHDDKFTVKCEISYYTNITKKLITNTTTPDLLFWQLTKTPDALLQNNKLSDVILVNRGEEFYAHKAILAARSPVFEEMFVNNPGPQLYRVEIPDLSYETFSEMLRFIYTYKVNNIGNIVLELLAAADAYGLKDLKFVCGQHLLKSVTLRDAPDVLILAEKFRSEYLKDRLKELIMDNAPKVKNTTEFKSLTNSHPQLAQWALHITGNLLKQVGDITGQTLINPA